MISGPPPDPRGRPRLAHGDSGGGFFGRRPNGRLRSPRPLTPTEAAVLRQAAEPVLADLAASGLGVPDIRDEAREEREAAVCGWVQGPGQTGEGVWVLADSSPAEQVAQLAEQVQNWAADQLRNAGRPPEWPECPQHPRLPHRLDPQVRSGRAVWVCWQTDQAIWPVGDVDTG